MIPRTAQGCPDIGAYLAARAQVDRRVVRTLAEAGHWDIVDAVFGEEVPALLMGSAPRLREVASR